MTAKKLTLVTIVVSILCMALAMSVLADDVRILFIGDTDNITYKALTRLGYELEVVEPIDQTLSAVNPSDYDIIISGWRVRRDFIFKDSAISSLRLSQAIQGGTTFIGFRHIGTESWAPSPLKKGRDYYFGHFVQEDHPILSTPNRLTEDDIITIKGGLSYLCFTELGSGWVPILAADGSKPAAWAESYDGDVYSLIEMALGSGKIILCHLVPDEVWERDGWSDDSAGKFLLENIMHYAMQ